MNKIDPKKLKAAIHVDQYYRKELGEPKLSKKDHWIYYCPFHEDRNTPNLAVYHDGRFKCFACGESGDILEFHKKKNNLFFPDTLKDLANKYAPHLMTDGLNIADEYDYKNEQGKVKYQVVRLEPKDFRQRVPDKNEGWKWGLNGTKPILYRLPELLSSSGAVFIVEGEKDVDNLIGNGLTATCNPMGAGKWREGYNPHLKGRIVVILEDNDQPGQKHGKKVAESLLGVAKSIKIIRFPELPKGGDLSDYLDKHLLDDLNDLIKNAPLFTGNYAEYFGENPSTVTHPLNSSCSDADKEVSGPYEMNDRGIIWNKVLKYGPVSIPLTNFSARIVAEVEEDDGAEVVRRFEIEAKLNGRTHKFPVKVSDFCSLGWTVRELGANAIISPGNTIKDHARCAIQMFSRNTDQRTIYTHLGWRKIDGRWIYLNPGISIGPEGPISEIQVACGDTRLRDYSLPSPPKGEELINSIRDSLSFLDLAPPHITLPLLASVFRSVLGEVSQIDFSLFLVGPTGCQKTELTAMAQAHFGAGFHGKNLPGNWSTTANSLEKQAFTIKDAFFTVDDFAPSGTQSDVARLHREAGRLLRAQGNRAGRGRMRPDGTLRPERFPRGLIVSSGEDIPKGQSVRARCLILEVSPGDVSLEMLSKVQTKAAQGVFAQTIAAFIQWLAPQMDTLRESAPQARIKLRDKASHSKHVHARTPDMVASLMWGWDSFLRFAHESGVLTEVEREELENDGWYCLTKAAQAQVSHLQNEDPASRFIELIHASLSSGMAHVAEIHKGGVPENPTAWGWRAAATGNGEWQPMGTGIGWVDDEENLYLQPDAAFAAVQRLSKDQGTAITVGSKTMWKRLDEEGFIGSKDAEPGRHTIRKKIEGKHRRVLHLKENVLYPPNTGHCGQSGQSNPKNEDLVPVNNDRKQPVEKNAVIKIGQQSLLPQGSGPECPECPEMEDKTTVDYVEKDL